MKCRIGLVLVGLVLLLSAGCASTGRSSFSFALIDLDLRDKEQLAAANGFEVPQTREVSTWWGYVTEIIGAVKGRVRILSLEGKSEALSSEGKPLTPLYLLPSQSGTNLVTSAILEES